MAAGAVVVADVPAGARVAGVPARPLQARADGPRERRADRGPPPRLVAAALVVAALALRLYRLGHEDLWIDEVFQLRVSAQPLGDIVANYRPRRRVPHPHPGPGAALAPALPFRRRRGWQRGVGAAPVRRGRRARRRGALRGGGAAPAARGGAPRRGAPGARAARPLVQPGMPLLRALEARGAARLSRAAARARGRRAAVVGRLDARDGRRRLHVHPARARRRRAGGHGRSGTGV